jgi:acetylornithine deacetylase/succinyl-diaminopimelate desuccinylase-like protein
MGSRQDALTAAAEMVLCVERHCESRPPMVGTVGKMTVVPGAVNVIAQDVEFTVDLRSADDAQRREAVRALQAEFEQIARRRRVSVDTVPFYSADAALCDPRLQQQLAGAIAAHSMRVHRLPSGAGHDAMVFPAVAPMAMLFVRCGNNGISHHPDETMTAADADIATSVLLHFFENFQPPQ